VDQAIAFDTGAGNRESGCGSAIAGLGLFDFRCFASLRLDLGPEPVVLTGPNGAGKTNILEAVSLLGPGRGLRRAQLTEIGRKRDPALAEPSRPWAVVAQVAGPFGGTEIATGVTAAAPERRQSRIDGAPVRGQAAIAERISVAWLTPEQDRLFLEGPGPRRRFLDRLLLGHDPGHADRLGSYEHAMRERGRLLREGSADPVWLTALEARMAEHGVAIAAARAELVRRLDAEAARRIGPFPAPRLGLTGEVEAWIEAGPALAAEEKLRDRLRLARGRDGETGGASAGPHLSDLAVCDRARGVAAARCSTGEQKALLVAIILANARLVAAAGAAAPILLLDEVAAHLDSARRTALFDEVLALGTQAWMTGTDPDLFGALGRRAQFIRVAQAAVRQD
jgi:DNA replication and repair protein RecF